MKNHNSYGPTIHVSFLEYTSPQARGTSTLPDTMSQLI